MGRWWWRFLKLFFRLLYNEFAWTYDLVAWLVSMGSWKAWGRTSIPRLRGERVLELAHGPGHLQVAMRERGLLPVGLDLSPYMGRIARRRLRRHGLWGRANLVRGRAEALPFPDASFESVVATFPSEFILAPETLRETTRVLTADGRLVVVAWVRIAGKGVFARLLDWLYRVTGQSDSVPGMGQAALRQAGFEPRVEAERVGLGEVMLVVADKQPDGSGGVVG